MLDWKIGFKRQKTGKGIALLIGKLLVKSVGAEDSQPLRLRHLSQVAKGSSDQAAAVLGKPAILLQRTAKLLPLWRSEVFYRFGVFQHASALLRRHIIKLSEAVPHRLLRLRWKIAEAGFLFERALLIGQGHVAMTVHPLPQVLLILPSRTTCIHRGTPRLPRSTHRRRLGRNHRRRC